MSRRLSSSIEPRAPKDRVQDDGLGARVFELFDFFVLGDDVYKDIIDQFVEGRI